MVIRARRWRSLVYIGYPIIHELEIIFGDVGECGGKRTNIYDIFIFV